MAKSKAANYDKPQDISTRDSYIIPDWNQRGISSSGYGKTVDFSEASNFIDPSLLDMTQLGGSRMSLTQIVPGGTYQFGSGSVLAPGISWAADTDTGFYWISDGVFGVSANGVKIAEFNSSGGSVFIPSLTQGSVLFSGASGLVSQNNASFFWDNALTQLQVASLRVGTLANHTLVSSSPRVDFVISSTTEGRLAIATSNNDHITGSTSGDMCFRVNNDDLLISVDNGTNAYFKFNTSAQFVMTDIAVSRTAGTNGGRWRFEPTGATESSQIELVPGASVTPAGTITAQVLMYNVQGANYERGGMTWFSNEFIIDTDATGSGVFRPIGIYTSGVKRLNIKALTEMVFNDDGADYDHRWEGDTATHLLFLDAGAERVGINTSGPDRRLDVLDTAGAQLRLTYTDGSVYTDFLTNSSGNTVISNAGTVFSYTQSSSGGFLVSLVDNLSNTASSDAAFRAKVAGSSSGDPYFLFSVTSIIDWSVGIDNSDSDSFKISAAGALGSSDRMTIYSGGEFVLNEGGSAWSTRIEGDTDANLLFVDAVNDRVGIGMNNPSVKFHVTGEIRASTILSVGTNMATAGVVRVANNSGGLVGRNAANTDNIYMADITTGNIAYYGYGSTRVDLYGNTAVKFSVNSTGVSFYNATPVAQGTGGQNVTNNVTDTASTDGTIPDFTNGTIYATDYTNIRNAIFQLARMLKQDHDQLRAMGILT